MAKVTALAECPLLPSGPVDLDALFAACAAGKTAEEAVAAATANNPVPEEVKPEVVEAPVAEQSTKTEAATPAAIQE